VGRYARESYSEPLAVYEIARRRGMDLVTLTDHDTIEGNLRLAHLPDVFWSEEVSCILPSGTLVHVSVFDVSERDHEAITQRRRDGESLFAYLAERRIPAALNHMFSPMTGPRSTGDYTYTLSRVGLVECLNGNMPEGVNSHALEAAAMTGHAAVGGSDAHTLATVARAYTEVPGARSREEYLAALRAGAVVPRGRSGSYAQLVSDITRVTMGAFRDVVSALIQGRGGVVPVLALIPVVPLTTLIPLFAFVARAEAVLTADRDARKLGGWPGRLPTPVRGGPPLRLGGAAR
jgi:predicted metal-dependent phosphoesterase TrpH